MGKSMKSQSSKAAPKAKVTKKGALIKKAAAKTKVVPKTAAKKAGGKLSAKNLAMLGKVSLDEKVKQAVEQTDTPEEAAAVLKASMSKLEASKVWGQHQTHLKNDAAAAEEHQLTEGKHAKGLAAALWFISKKNKSYQTLQQSLGSNITVQKTDAWMSEKQAVDKFGWEELQAHLQSGRVISKEDPITRGVWQYKDVNDVTRSQSITRGKHLQKGCEYEPDEDEDRQFDELFDKDSTVILLNDLVQLSYPALFFFQLKP